MTTGEKIKYFRNMRGISQDMLGQLSGINSATIKKYEYGIRNPKPDQLLKIANALAIFKSWSGLGLRIPYSYFFMVAEFMPDN